MLVQALPDLVNMLVYRISELSHLQVLFVLVTDLLPSTVTRSVIDFTHCLKLILCHYVMSSQNKQLEKSSHKPLLGE